MNIAFSEHLQRAKDLSYSIQKFLTYCEHLQEELALGDGNSQEQHRGYGYILIIQYELLGNKSTNNSIGSEQVLDTLVLLLEEDFFDSDSNQYSNVYGMFRNILHYYQGEKNYAGKINKLKEKGTSLTAPNEVKMIGNNCILNMVECNSHKSIDKLTVLISDKALECLKNSRKKEIEELAGVLINTLLYGDERELTHPYLNHLLQLLEDNFTYDSMYMGIIHADFDELATIGSTYHKILNILGILVCDILAGDHELFENASELFLVRIRSEKTHRAVKYLCDEKTI